MTAIKMDIRLKRKAPGLDLCGNSMQTYWSCFMKQNESNKEIQIVLKTAQRWAIHKMFTMANLHSERSLQDCEEPVQQGLQLFAGKAEWDRYGLMVATSPATNPKATKATSRATNSKATNQSQSNQSNPATNPKASCLKPTNWKTIYDRKLAATLWINQLWPNQEH